MEGLDRASDRELWQRAHDGEAEAFGVLFDRHAKAVYNHCFRRTASWTAAEDLTSVVFLEAWRRHNDVVLREDSALPWLLGIANHVVRHRRRSVRRHETALARLPRTPAPPDVADDVAARVDDERTIRHVLDAFRRLPRRDQDVLSLCVWAGLDYASTAAALGVPVGTVRSRLARARSRLAPVLAAEGALPPSTAEEERA